MAAVGNFACWVGGEPCSEIVRNIDAWIHLKIWHWRSDDTQFRCRLCETTVSSVEDAFKHLRSEGHLENVMPAVVTTRIWGCQCTLTRFTTFEKLQSHLSEEVHKTCINVQGFVPKIICKCGEPFYQESDIQRHMKEFHGGAGKS